jgi:hypothetical protein
VKARGGRIHFFAVGRVFEQEDIGWLEDIVREGHAVGNHTYGHVNVTATKPEDVQFRFRVWSTCDGRPCQVALLIGPVRGLPRGEIAARLEIERDGDARGGTARAIRRPRRNRPVKRAAS